ncbi:recombination mediator RecR [Thermovibrio ammonificans]|uniref:Recombination protein RecR n=1 Tax=Thermovibrio ammonificans (strain DSM 15698 / JCM 12110 / HB-1) TaxID=648996 RepID=E8T3V2_THEA1|nr:recombination mediator RecR [Thermovibrio ammonificans]ADU97359.1 recombination protein RecR [Thermovibrio ammonificans HB-1]
MIYPENLELLIEYLAEVPGISERAAERAVLLLSRLPEERRRQVINAFRELEQVTPCKECGLPAAGELCRVCSDPERSRTTICVVEQPRDAISIEKLGEYKGLYHVLGGVISPLEGIGPEDLNVKSLFERIKRLGVKEVIIALNPTVEGEATAKFLVDRLQKLGVKVFRIGYGIPYGGTIDNADELTLKRAFEDKKLIAGGR